MVDFELCQVKLPSKDHCMVPCCTLIHCSSELPSTLSVFSAPQSNERSLPCTSTSACLSSGSRCAHEYITFSCNSSCQLLKPLQFTFIVAI